MKIAFSAILLAGTLSMTVTFVTAQVKVWQGTITLPTYEEGEPDPNPPFDIYARTEYNYPYPMRTNLTGVMAEHVWRAIFIENEYLACTVLPDLGGHLYTCIDKISRKSMFYANPSIKKAEIGHRGAWAAFGVEYNFPVSHNWVSMSPVDFAYTQNADGSASISIGNIDRPYGMQWGVELVLQPHAALLEERVTLYNRSDERHRFYWWDNAGVQVWDDSRLEYPMRYVAAHGFAAVYQWPRLTSGGKDLSLVGNHTDGPVSYFSHGTHETFMGVWNPKTNAGVAQFSDYRDLPAKKIWSWGSDADGIAWRAALSDDRSAYVEIQAGLFRNQETYAFLEPGQTIRFKEYWMPVRETGGISRANQAGVVNLATHGSDISAALNVNVAVPHAQVSITQDGTPLWNETIDLVPEKTWSHSVSATARSSKVTFELKDRDGHSLLKQTDGEYDWDPETTIATGPQQEYQVSGPGVRSEDDWLQFGTNQELNGQVVLALETYQNGLKKYPQSLSLEKASGRLATSLLRYSEAAPQLRAALERDTTNSEVAYYLGIAEEGLGNKREAETALQIAYRQTSFRAPAARRLGELEAQQGHLQESSIYLKAAVDASPLDLLAQEDLEAVTRAAGNTVEADLLARSALATNPMSDFLKEETAVPDLQHLAADPFRVLRVAAEYVRLGLYEKALTVLDRDYSPVPEDQSEPGSVLPQSHPLILYYAAYCKSKLGADTPGNWQAASRLSTHLVFPSTPVDRLVLETAVLANGNDATAHYLLGTLLFSKGLVDAGMAHWIEAKHLAPNLRVVDADLGTAWLIRKGDAQRALAFFLEGARNDPTNEQVYVGLDEAMSLTGVSASERAKVLSRYPLGNALQSPMPASLVYQLALTYAEAGQYEQALSLFTNRFFPKEEGAITSNQVLFEVRLMQAETDARTRRCMDAEGFLRSEVATSSSVNSSQAYFRMSKIARFCGHGQESTNLLRKAAASTTLTNLVWAVKAGSFLETTDAGRSEAKLRNAIPSSEQLQEISAYSGSHWYNIGMLQAALHHNTEAQTSFRNALILPDNFMSHHLSRVALSTLRRVPATTVNSSYSENGLFE